MTDLKVLVCDDEPLAVRRLTSLIGTIENVQIVGATTSGREAMQMIEVERPDLVLIDIEMPEFDGFDVVEAAIRSASDSPPLFVFVTGYRRFAPQAFDSGAIDFLSKPIRLSRLETAINRAREAMAGREARRRLSELGDGVAGLRDMAAQEDQHVWVTRRGEVVCIDLDRIERIAAEGAYVRLFIDGGSYLHREPLSTIEVRLDAERFVRVHRSHILRTDQVQSIKRTVYGGGEVILRSGEHIPIGRKYSQDARKRLMTPRRRRPTAA